MTGRQLAKATWRAVSGAAWSATAVTLGLTLAPSAALAATGMATDYEIGLQPAATDIADQIHSFHNGLFLLITAITLLVLGLLIYVMLRFNSRANPTPSHTHHNTLIEVIWTVAPILILVFVAIPSFRLLYAQYDLPKPDLTVKAVGNQWFWSYEYADQEGVAFDSFMLSDADIEKRKAGGELLPRLLAVDNEVVVPVNAVVHVIVTSKDVIHNWTVQSFGSKVDAVPGRVTSTWFKAREKGVYYGQCSELCGRDHAFMPIAVRAVSPEKFEAWATAAAEDIETSYAVLDAPPAETESPDGAPAAPEG